MRDIFILEGNYYPYFECGDAVVVDPTVNNNIKIGDWALFEDSKGKTFVDKYSPDRHDQVIGKILTLVKTLHPKSF